MFAKEEQQQRRTNKQQQAQEQEQRMQQQVEQVRQDTELTSQSIGDRENDPSLEATAKQVAESRPNSEQSSFHQEVFKSPLAERLLEMEPKAAAEEVKKIAEATPLKEMPPVVLMLLKEAGYDLSEVEQAGVVVPTLAALASASTGSAPGATTGSAPGVTTGAGSVSAFAQIAHWIDGGVKILGPKNWITVVKQERDVELVRHYNELKEERRIAQQEIANEDFKIGSELAAKQSLLKRQEDILQGRVQEDMYFATADPSIGLAEYMTARYGSLTGGTGHAKLSNSMNWLAASGLLGEDTQKLVNWLEDEFIPWIHQAGAEMDQKLRDGDYQITYDQHKYGSVTEAYEAMEEERRAAEAVQGGIEDAWRVGKDFVLDKLPK